MPSVSKAQNQFWHAMAEHPEEAAAHGIKPSVTREFLNADHGRSLKSLPEHVKPVHKAEGGAVYPRPFKW